MPLNPKKKNIINGKHNSASSCIATIFNHTTTVTLLYVLMVIAFFDAAMLVVAEAEITNDGTSNNIDDNNSITSTNNIKKFDLNIGLTLLNPDCFNESYSMLVINNQFPAPALHVVKNDVVQISVRNQDADNNQTSSIHFHGIRQYGTVFSDGVAGITQLPIMPGQEQEYIHEFQVLNQSGTFYYHAHVGVQDDTIQGPFIVHETEEALLAATGQKQVDSITAGCATYHDERILQWTEYWHQSLYDRETYYMSSSFTNDNGPDSILLNGRTVYDVNSASNSNNGECKGFSTIDVEPNKIYRLRFIGALTFRVLGIFIQDHDMTLIEIDGEYVEPCKLDKYLEIAAGQRMSVLIHTGNYSAGTLFPIASNYRWKNGLGYTKNGYGYLRYISPSTTELNDNIMDVPSISDFPADIFPSIDTPGWVLSNVKPWSVKESDIAITSGKPAHTIKLSMKEVIEADNTTRYRNNGRAHVPWGTSNASLLDQIVSGSLGPIGELSSIDGFSTNHQTYPVGHGQIIDLVFQNNFIPAGICVAHPWHTHGHSHYLLAEGPGDYMHDRDKDIRTFQTPLLKDVSMAYPAIVDGSEGCGWTKVRIFTDNPGIWAVHCHITSHMLQGKMVILEVAADMILSTRRTFYC